MRQAAVVLVHGLFSSTATWSDIGARLGEDTVLGQTYDVFYMKYESPRIRFSPLRGIPDYDIIAASLANYLDTEVDGHERVVLVGHSQGGLIIQRYLARMATEGRARRLARIRAVILLACPNTGSEIVILFRRVLRFWNNPQERELRPINEKVSAAHAVVLRHIQNAGVLDDHNCPIPIYTYAGESDRVVTPTSAAGFFDHAEALPGDHSTILRASSPNSRTFRTLRRHLVEVLELSEPNRIRHNLAPLEGTVLDRADEIDSVVEGLRSGHRVVCLSGLGGIGKTTIANRVAWRCVQGGEGVPPFDAVVWHDCSAGAGGDALIESIAEVMGYPQLRRRLRAPAAAATIESLGDERVLVILDNFEPAHRPALEGIVAQFDPSRGKVLVTSRSEYPGEAWPVPVRGLDADTRAALFADEGRRRGLPVGGRDADGAVASYLEATGGNPYAIRLTAARMQSGADIRSVTAGLREGTDIRLFTRIFDQYWRDLLERDRPVRELIASIALHPGAVTRAAAGSATGLDDAELDDSIAVLTGNCLIEVRRDSLSAPGRLDIHPLTKAYARRRLAEVPAMEAIVQDRLIDHYLRVATGNADIYTRPDRVHRLESERHDILHFADCALRRAHRTGERSDYLDVVRFGEAMARFLWGRGYWRDRISLCEKAAEAAQAADDGVALARQHAMIGRVHVWLGDFEAARRSLERSKWALPVDAADVDRRETVRLAGHIASGTGDHATARALFGSILDISPPASADDEGRAATLVELGVCALRDGDPQEAIERFEEARRLDGDMNSDEGMAVTLSHLADARFEAGDYRQVRQMFETGLELATRVDRVNTRGRCHLGLAKLAVLDRNYVEAERHASSAREVFDQLGTADLRTEADSIVHNLAGTGDPASSGPGLADLFATCRAVIFDFDDTIAATRKTRWPVLRRTAAEFGVDLDVATLRQAWGLPFGALVKTIVPTVDPDVFVPRYRQAMAMTTPKPEIGAISVIEALRRRGVEMSIVGSGSRDLIVQDLDALGLGGCFGQIVGYEQSRVHKPDPRVLQPAVHALGEAGKTRAEIVYIGDSLRDFWAAAGNRIGFVAVLTGTETRTDFVESGLADNLIVRNLAQLRIWI